MNLFEAFAAGHLPGPDYFSIPVREYQRFVGFYVDHQADAVTRTIQ